MISNHPDCIIVTSRQFAYPIEQVFRAWSEPELLKRWWGPAGFTNTFLEFDFRPGGIWRFTMHGPEKGNYPNEVEFVEIKPPVLISWKRHSKPLFQVIAAFESKAIAETFIRFHMVFDTPEECNKLKPYVIDKNEENFDKLEMVLAEM